jgi:hypothetical protein
MRGKGAHKGDGFARVNGKSVREEPVGLLMNTISSSGNFIGMTGICLDRLLKQRSALRKPDFSSDFPPPRGGLRSLSVRADCIAPKSRAPSELLS